MIGGARRRRGPQRWRSAAAALGVMLAVAGCGSATGPGVESNPGPSSTTGVALPAPSPVAPVIWTACPSAPTLECGTVSVPVDYRRPNGPTLTLSVSRAPALDPTDPGGTLLFNPGGPGQSGNQILPVVLSLFPPSIRRDFDIVSFDPRGTGTSDPLRCGTSPSVMTSLVPVPAPGRPLPGTPQFTAMARACARVAGAVEPYVNTTDTARDMDRIRQALGVTTVSYYGLSYGTVLGSVYADLFPHRVRAMVLDGAVDANATLIQQADEQAPAAERSVEHLLATCGPTPSCPLGTDPEAYFRSLAASLAAHPLPPPGGGDSTPVTLGDLDTATLFAISVPGFTPLYDSALVAATAGNGAPLRSLALELATDVNGDPLVDPLWAITCNDAARHPGPRAAGTLARALQSKYPLIGGYAVNYAMGGCVAWPAARQPVEDLHPTGTPPIMVIGNTGDPNTPLTGARHLAAAIPRARLVTWAGWGHTWLLSGPGNSCMQRVVSTYLGHGTLPPVGTVCN